MIRKWFIIFLCLFCVLFSLNGKMLDHPHSITETNLPSPFIAKDFSHLLGHVKGINDEVLKMHFILYNGYVKNANKLFRILEEMRIKETDKTLAYGALERRFVWEFDGMVLHELYFENLGSSGFLDRKNPLYQKIEMDFGSIEQWKKNFAATGLIRGIGWVVLYQNPKTAQLNNVWVEEHNINLIPGGKPLLVMDVWEHAYITEYGLDRAAYIEAFFENINWNTVSSRYLDDITDKNTHTHVR